MTTKQQHDRQSRGWLANLAELFLQRSEAEPARSESRPKESDSAYQATTQQLGRMLDELDSKREGRRAELERQAAIATGRSADAIEAKDKRAIKLQRTEQIYERMRTDILAMHQTLGTSVSFDDVDDLHRYMVEIAGFIAPAPGAGLDDRIRGTVADRVYQEAGPTAWKRLIALMKAADVEWPSLSSASGDKWREHELAEAADFFVNSKPSHAADLIIGVVGVWQDHYPDPDSPLWRQVQLRAVGSALRTQSIRRIVEYLREHNDELRGEAQTLLADEMAAVQSVLAGGVNCVEDADRVMRGATRLFEEVLPDICWNRAKHLLDAPRPLR